MSASTSDPEDRLAYNRRQAEAFDQAAHRFEEPIPEDVWARMEAIVQAAHLQPGQAVLDVGTGTGALLLLILEERPARVEACDLSGEMLKRARRRFGRRVVFYQADVVDLVGVVEPVDVVFCNACFGNLYSGEGALRSIWQLLRPGGRVLITHPMGKGFVRELRERNPDMVRRDLPGEAELRRLLKATGLSPGRFTDEPQLYIAVGRRPRA